MTNQFSCDDISQCKFKAPVIGASLSKSACDLYGGTFCPNPPDCTELKDCVESYKQSSKNDDGTTKEGRGYFLNYLELSPTITDETVNDVNVCGQAREYFGFDATFINDGSVLDRLDLYF